jgi:hypothetical protein
VWLKLAANHYSPHYRGLKIGYNAKYSPIVVTLAHANIINLTLILDYALILIPWFKLYYFIFGLLT